MKLLRRTLSAAWNVWRVYNLFDFLRDHFEDFL